MFVTRGTKYHVSWVLPSRILARFRILEDSGTKYSCPGMIYTSQDEEDHHDE
jgi:hypothetical protein